MSLPGYPRYPRFPSTLASLTRLLTLLGPLMVVLGSLICSWLVLMASPTRGTFVTSRSLPPTRLFLVSVHLPVLHYNLPIQFHPLTCHHVPWHVKDRCYHKRQDTPPCRSMHMVTCNSQTLKTRLRQLCSRRYRLLLRCLAGTALCLPVWLLMTASYAWLRIKDIWLKSRSVALAWGIIRSRHHRVPLRPCRKSLDLCNRRERGHHHN